MRALFISPHTDDLELGCGGTVAKYSARGTEVFALVFSTCRDAVPSGFEEDALEKECRSALSELGVKKNNITILDYKNREFAGQGLRILDELEAIKRDVRPELVFCPSLSDRHQDHQVVAKETERAFRDSFGILSYEQPWNCQKFSPDYYELLSGQDLDKKMAALRHYKTQAALSRRYFKEEFLTGLACVRGCQAWADFAEAFEVIRLVAK